MSYAPARNIHARLIAYIIDCIDINGVAFSIMGTKKTWNVSTKLIIIIQQPLVFSANSGDAIVTSYVSISMYEILPPPLTQTIRLHYAQTSA